MPLDGNKGPLPAVESAANKERALCRVLADARSTDAGRPLRLHDPAELDRVWRLYPSLAFSHTTNSPSQFFGAALHHCTRRGGKRFWGLPADRPQHPPATMDDDLYDEFGNFIGEEVEASEEESEHGVDVGNFAYDGYPEEAPGAHGHRRYALAGNQCARMWKLTRHCRRRAIERRHPP